MDSYFSTWCASLANHKINVADVTNQLIVKYTTVHSLLVRATVYISMFIAQHTLEHLAGRRVKICMLKNFYTDNGK